jgi:hypothetical protein
MYFLHADVYEPLPHLRGGGGVSVGRLKYHVLKNILYIRDTGKISGPRDIHQLQYIYSMVGITQMYQLA